MGDSLTVLLVTAASIGFIHTVLGPDHYLPFIVMGRVRGWSQSKTLAITGLCGVGHVLGSILLGAAGAALGIAVGSLEAVEAVRGTMAAWLLIGFGAAYTVWGLRLAVRRRPHTHSHHHGDGTAHAHVHDHRSAHAHVHDGTSLTPWVLFVIFVLGPCEPLIPVLMYPALEMGPAEVMIVAAVFGVVTVMTMLAAVLLASWGLRFVKLEPLARWSHAMAGAMIALSGLAIEVLGL